MCSPESFNEITNPSATKRISLSVSNKTPHEGSILSGHLLWVKNAVGSLFFFPVPPTSHVNNMKVGWGSSAHPQSKTPQGVPCITRPWSSSLLTYIEWSTDLIGCCTGAQYDGHNSVMITQNWITFISTSTHHQLDLSVSIWPLLLYCFINCRTCPAAIEYEYPVPSQQRSRVIGLVYCHKLTISSRSR